MDNCKVESHEAHMKRKPGGGRKSLSNEPTVKIEITLPQSLKVAIVAYAQMRSTQESREVTVSELIRNAIPDIIAVRFDSAQAACDIACLDKVVSEWVKNNQFVDANDAPLRAAWSSEYGSLSLSLESEEIAAAENFDLFTFMDAVKYRHLNAKLVNGNIKIGNKLFSPEKSNHPIVL